MNSHIYKAFPYAVMHTCKFVFSDEIYLFDYVLNMFVLTFWFQRRELGNARILLFERILPLPCCEIRKCFLNIIF